MVVEALLNSDFPSSNGFFLIFWRSVSMNKIYVGNLSYQSNEQDLEGLFSQFGNIVNINVIIDRETGRSKGFGFVEFDGKEGAEGAVSLDGSEFQGRKIRVNIAKERTGSAGGAGRR